MKTVQVRSVVTILLIVSLILVGCNASTPTLEPTVTPVSPSPTMPSTSTATATVTSSPTATSTPQPTDTATPLPTATNTPVKFSPTAKPSVTPKAAVTAEPAVAANTAAIPAGSALNVAVKITFNNVQTLLGELNNVMAGYGGRCSVAMGDYDAIATAPTYDVSGQSNDTQTAYALYRQAIDLINSTADKVRRVCQGGGAIDKLDIQVAQKSAGDALGPLGHAIDLLPPAVLPTPGTVKATATPVPQKIALSDLLLKTMDQMHNVGGILDGAQLNLDSNFCSSFVPQYQTIITIVNLDQNNREAVWAAQYNTYKLAISYFQNKLYRAKEVCDAGGGKIGKDEFSNMRRDVDVSAFTVARAYDELKRANLLGR